MEEEAIGIAIGSIQNETSTTFRYLSPVQWLADYVAIGGKRASSTSLLSIDKQIIQYAVSIHRHYRPLGLICGKKKDMLSSAMGTACSAHTSTKPIPMDNLIYSYLWLGLLARWLKGLDLNPELSRSTSADVAIAADLSLCPGHPHEPRANWFGSPSS
ncbi:hypothetical protein BJ508DRAFT_378664 [Ascobolus immersus RN42]|uniref:Uncharacterized protein n=1 Tax=Ascobolus immersus RN42 TaxID=1160509 RepID=A0A3N4HXN3_ASCIM|nr:hypothetical protein BJ508DRAFT_378664 [Ascobolus immersus RN42]